MYRFTAKVFYQVKRTYKQKKAHLNIFYHVVPIGAIYRYWESRRRIFNDSQPDCALAVEENKKN